MKRYIFSTSRQRVLCMAIAAACVAPLPVLAENPQVADGSLLDLPAGAYTTSSAGASVLVARNGGVVKAGGSVNLNSSGAGAYGALVMGAGSSVVLSGGSVYTGGSGSHALGAYAGGNLVIDASAGGAMMAVTAAASNASALFADGVGTVVDLNRVALLTLGGATGAQLYDGATLTLRNGSITTQGSRASGVLLGAGSSLRLDGTSITTSGDDSSAVYLGGVGSNNHAYIANSLLVSGGRGSFGLHLGVGDTAQLVDTQIQTVGAQSHGISFDNGANMLALNGTAIATQGDNAAALFAVGSGNVSADQFTFQTAGYNALGVDNRAALVTLSHGSVLTTGENAFGLYAWQGNTATSIVANDVNVRTEGNGSTATVARDGAQVALTTSTLTTMGENALGTDTRADSHTMVTGSVIQTYGRNAYGALARDGAALAELTGSTVLTHGEGAFGIVAMDGGNLSLSNTHVQTEGVQAWGAALGSTKAQGSQISLDGGLLYATQAGAVFAEGGTSLAATQGAGLIGGNGILLGVDAAATSPVNVAFDDSYGVGDVVRTDIAGHRQQVDGPRLAELTLDHDSLWKGATDAVDRLVVANGSSWALTDSSSVGSLQLDQGSIAFTDPADGAYQNLAVKGDVTGSGGLIAMHTTMNAGGPLLQQQTDRLLIEGDVRTTGTTYLQVTPHGTGALTDLNRNGSIDASEGISLVQVGGQSRADAFALQGGYVAVGPWQYTLHAFGPGQTAADQNALASGPLQWDYRLGNAYVAEGGGDPGPIQPPVRPAVVPQLPSYLVAPTALLHYGTQIIDTLHQRLGDIRSVPSDDGLGGEVFARYIGSQQRYGSDRSFSDYGYAFDQQIHAQQLGGSIIGWTHEHSSLRAGWALDQGTTRVNPDAADGSSRADYRAHGFSAWMTWQQDNGLYVDAVLGGERYRGEVATAARGSAATVRAHGWTASLEAGYNVALGRGWSIEPQAQLIYQSLNFQDLEDGDGLRTRIAPPGQTTSRLGARISKADDRRLVPYARLDVLQVAGGRPQLQVASDDWNVQAAFDGGRVGTSLRVGAGLSSQLTDHIALYGEADYVGDVAGYGFRGWTASAGLRFNF